MHFQLQLPQLGWKRADVMIGRRGRLQGWIQEEAAAVIDVSDHGWKQLDSHAVLHGPVADHPSHEWRGTQTN